MTTGLAFDGPSLVAPEGPGLGVEIDDAALRRARELYAQGQGNISVLDSDLPRRFFPAY